MEELATMPSPDGTACTPGSSTDILAKVVWIVGHLDDEGLDDLRDLPILELAKHISLVGGCADDL